MKNNKIFASLLVLASSFVLASCGETKVETTVTDETSGSHYGKVEILNAKETYSAGDTLNLKVTPIEDYLVTKVEVNGTALTANNDGTYTYTVVEGANKIKAYYDVDKTVDFVDKFKLNIDEDTFYLATKKSDMLDFRTDGVEEMMTEYTDPKDYFINYVDGDTTHVSTRHYGYTVKIRYLGIDTPESTSDLEEWGKTASIFNKKTLSGAKHILLESQGWARGDDDKAATADGNQRSLAYVWYSTLENPTIDDYRCLNLEMVYQGLSQGIGSLEDMGEYFYWAFDAANKSAEANKRGQYSGVADENYYYVSEDNPAKKLTLKEVYSQANISGSPSSLSTPLFDVSDAHNDCSKTLYQIEGYVTRKVGCAFYFQDKPSYEMPSDGSLPEAYGMYVFTYTQTPIKVGDYVSVIGILSSYSGAFQMMGISYHDFDVDPLRDTQIIAEKSVDADQIKPITITKEQYANYGNSKHGNLNHVLVSFEDEVYCYKDSTFTDGGIREVDRYNTHYPFYCSTNKLIFFGHLGSSSDSNAVRIVEDADILCTYGAETSNTYKFWTGGTNYYNPEGAEYVYNWDGVSGAVLDSTNAETDEERAIAAKLITTTYQAKKTKLTGIWGNYISSSGKNYRDQITIVSPADVTITGTY